MWRSIRMGVREGGTVEQTLDLAEPGFSASDADGEGNVLGVEFLSLKEYTELVTHFGGVLGLPDKVEDPADLPLPGRG